MIAWQRAILPTLCGRCGATIPVGAPMKVITLAFKSGRANKARCAACDGPAPPDLPELVEQRSRTPLTMARFTPDMLPLTFKQREPGEEG